MKKILAIVLLVVMSLMATVVLAENVPTAAKVNPTVTVEGGKLIGFKQGETYCFWGVDYAYADRFEAPQKVEPWEGYKYAQSYGCVSLIPDQTAVGADEFVWPHRYWIQNDHCQNLNIWTQSLDTEAKKPVIVFFHGGGMNNGSSIESAAYDGQNLSEWGDVVVVTVNHRLNAIGFLDLSSFGEGYETTANNGMLDLVASLEWIKANIAQFGGDPENVTIFGQSGGGRKVSTLMQMPAAEGLFDQAGCISGGNPVAQDPEAVGSARIGELTAEILGLTAETIDEIKTMDYQTVLKASLKAQEMAKAEGYAAYKWGPVVDGVNVLDTFIGVEDMPVIVSFCFSESANASYKTGDQRHNEWTDEETMEWLKSRFGDNTDAILAEFLKVYPNKEAHDLYFLNNRHAGVLTLTNALVEAGADVYNYSFEYEAPTNGGTTAFHCVDLIYLFHNVDFGMCAIATGANEDALRIQDQLAGAFLNMAKNGTPSTEELPWAAYTVEGRECLHVDVETYCAPMDDVKLLELYQ